MGGSKVLRSKRSEVDALVLPVVRPGDGRAAGDARERRVDHRHREPVRGKQRKLGMRFRLETGSEILAPPVVSETSCVRRVARGEVFAMHEMTG